jgi:hypothetical protein
MSKTRSIITKCKNQSKYDLIMSLRKIGMTYEQIGNYFNPKVTRQAVNKVVKNYERRWGTKKADA